MTRALLLLLLLAFASHSSAEELVLYGAGSLREALTAITADYSKATGIAVSTQFGSSGLMREKIEAGAEADCTGDRERISAGRGHRPRGGGWRRVLECLF